MTPLRASVTDINTILNRIGDVSKCKLFITSGHRNKKHNKRVGGARHSFHLTDRARDFYPISRTKNCSIKLLAQIACKYGSVIVYPTHLHIDNRKKKICIYKSQKNKPRVAFVVMDNMKFYPDVTYINKGWKVIWYNNSKRLHNIYPLKKKYLKKGKSYGMMFNTAGTFKYYCTPHRKKGMKGRIIVHKTK